MALGGAGPAHAILDLDRVGGDTSPSRRLGYAPASLRGRLTRERRSGAAASQLASTLQGRRRREMGLGGTAKENKLRKRREAPFKILVDVPTKTPIHSVWNIRCLFPPLHTHDCRKGEFCSYFKSAEHIMFQEMRSLLRVPSMSCGFHGSLLACLSSSVRQWGQATLTLATSSNTHCQAPSSSKMAPNETTWCVCDEVSFRENREHPYPQVQSYFY